MGSLPQGRSFPRIERVDRSCSPKLNYRRHGMSTITIDGYAWSGRTKVASLLSKALKSRLIDKTQISLIAEQQGFQGNSFLKRLESNHTVSRRISDFIFHHMTLSSFNANTSESNVFSFPSTRLIGPEQSVGIDGFKLGKMFLNSRNLHRALESIILEFTGSHNSVIIGCGAEKILGEDPAVLKIFLTAPKEIRIARAKLELNLTDKIAAQKIATLDKNRARFHQQTFNNTWDDRSNYDLYLDSGTLDYGNITEFILTKELNTELYDRQVLTATLN